MFAGKWIDVPFVSGEPSGSPALSPSIVTHIDHPPVAFDDEDELLDEEDLELEEEDIELLEELLEEED